MMEVLYVASKALNVAAATIHRDVKMKVRRVIVQNVLSFAEPAELLLDGDIAILIGPNGGGKTNLLDIISHILRTYLLKSWLLKPHGTAEIPERQEFYEHDRLRDHFLPKHTTHQSEDQVMTVSLEVTELDIANMQVTKEIATDIYDKLSEQYIGGTITVARKRDLDLIKPNQILNIL